MDPVDRADLWHRWSVKGTGEVLARVIDGVDASLPPGWARLVGDAARPFQTPGHTGGAWYSLGSTAEYVGVVLSVVRAADAELRGGRVWFAGPPHPAPTSTIPGAWEQVTRFLEAAVLPAARAAGAQLLVPTPEGLFLSDLPPEVASRLRRFSDSARKELPLNRDEAEAWRAFVVDAYRARAVVDPARLSGWLVQAGWAQADAAELALRFFDQCLLLTRYADEVSAA